jgi:PKD repeat protein
MIRFLLRTRLHVFLCLMLFVFLQIAAMAQVNFTMTGYSSNGCRPQNITFTASATGANSYTWDFNDGTALQTTASANIIHNFTHGGSFQVKLTAYNGITNIGNSQAIVNIGGINGNIQSTTDSACVGEQVEFYIYGNVNNYQWNFGDPASGTNNFSTQSKPSHAFNAPGTYAVLIKSNTNPCGMDSITKIIVVNNSVTPNKNFNFSRNNCPGDPVNFNAANYHATNVSWNFGDPGSGVNNTSTSSNPVHAYAAVGKYAVTFTITNSCGQTASKVDSVQIQTGIKWGPNNFSANIYEGQGSSGPFKGCPGDNFDFYTQAVAATYTWNFGDGTPTASNMTPSHIYDSIGTYTLSLVLQNGCLNDTTITRIVTIGSTIFGGNPSINTANSVCPGDKIFFNANPNGKAHLWTFGDGTTSTLSSPAHSYASKGTKTITLKLTNNCGVDTTISKNIVVDTTIVPVLIPGIGGNGNGNWGLMPNPACPGDLVSLFTYGGSSYNVDFGDGYSTTHTIPLVTPNGTYDVASHPYSSLGTFKVKLTYYNACGNSAKDSINVTIGGALPVSNGKVNIIDNSPYITCKPIGFLGSGGSSYDWDFGNGYVLPTTSLPIIQYAYPVAGNFTISLKVTNGCGNSATYTQNITIDPIPNPSIIKSGDTLITSPATTYQWKLNGTNIAGATNAKYIAAVSGNYTVAITDVNGCAASSSFLNCFVKSSPNVGICPGASAQLNASGASTYSWSPSTGLNNPSIANPVASPAIDTKYFVTGTTAGCPPKTDSVMVSNITSLVANAGLDKTICSGSSTALNGSGGGSYSWSPATGLSSTTVANPTASLTSNQTYTLTVTSGSCNSTDQVTINVDNAPSVTAGIDRSICPDIPTIALSGSSTHAAGITWSTTGTGTFSPNVTTANATYTPSASDKINSPVTLSITTNGSGVCSAVSDQTVINILPAPVAIANADQTICANSSGVSLNGSIVAATGGTWSGGGTFSPSATTLNAIYSPSASEIAAGTAVLTLTTTGNGTCTASSNQMVITITPLASVANAGSDQNVCSSTATLNAAAPTIGTGAWTVSSGPASVTNAASPTSGVTGLSGASTLVWTVSNSCSSTSDNVVITQSANAAATVSVTSNVTNNHICQGGAITFTGFAVNGGTPTYQWKLNSSPISSATNVTYTSSALANSDQLSLVMTSTLGCATGSPATSNTITMIVDPIASTANAGSDQNITVSNATLSANAATSGTGVWTVAAGTAVFGNSANPTTIVTGLAMGTNKLAWTITSGVCSASTDTVTINVTTPTGINNVVQVSSNNVYPNPFTEEVNIKFSNVQSNMVLIKVTDLAGKVVKTFEHDTANDLKLGNDLNIGMYCVQIIYADHIEITRIVKM